MSPSIDLSDEAYALLSALKGPHESFSDVVMRELSRGRRPLALLELKDLLDPETDPATTQLQRRGAEDTRDRNLGAPLDADRA